MNIVCANLGKAQLFDYAETFQRIFHTFVLIGGKGHVTFQSIT